jgi:hypothetical protein
MKMQTWTLVVVAITLLTGVAYGAAPTSPATVAQVGFQHAWLCVGVVDGSPQPEGGGAGVVTPECLSRR